MKTFADIDLKDVKGVLLDLDDTLYSYDICHFAAIAGCKLEALTVYGISEERFHTAWDLARKRVHDDLHGQGASHSRLLYFQKQFELLSERTDAEYSLRMEEKYWSVFLETMQMDEGARIFLDTVKKKNLRTCIVTDLTAQIQLRKWTKLHLGEYIDFLVSSEEAGMEKPATGIFALALEKLNLHPEDVIMIGDNEKKDITGAVAMGIRAYHIKATDLLSKQ